MIWMCLKFFHRKNQHTSRQRPKESRLLFRMSAEFQAPFIYRDCSDGWSLFSRATGVASLPGRLHGTASVCLPNELRTRLGCRSPHAVTAWSWGPSAFIGESCSATRFTCTKRGSGTSSSLPRTWSANTDPAPKVSLRSYRSTQPAALGPTSASCTQWATRTIAR